MELQHQRQIFEIPKSIQCKFFPQLISLFTLLSCLNDPRHILETNNGIIALLSMINILGFMDFNLGILLGAWLFLQLMVWLMLYDDNLELCIVGFVKNWLDIIFPKSICWLNLTLGKAHGKFWILANWICCRHEMNISCWFNWIGIKIGC